MNVQQADKVSAHLQPGESLQAIVNSSSESSAVNTAVAGGLGGLLGGGMAHLWSRHQGGKAPRALSGLVGLTDRRVMAVGRDGSVVEVHRPGIIKLKVTESKLSPGMQRVDVVTRSRTYEIHGRHKQVQLLLDELRAEVEVVESKPDRMALAKSIPLIFGYMIGAVVGFVAVAGLPQEWLALIVAVVILAATDALRRLLFR